MLFPAGARGGGAPSKHEESKVFSPSNAFKCDTRDTKARKCSECKDWFPLFAPASLKVLADTDAAFFCMFRALPRQPEIITGQIPV